MYWNILLVRAKPAVSVPFPVFKFILIYLQHDAGVLLVTVDKVTGGPFPEQLFF